MAVSAEQLRQQWETFTRYLNARKEARNVSAAFRAAISHLQKCADAFHALDAVDRDATFQPIQAKMQELFEANRLAAMGHFEYEQRCADILGDMVTAAENAVHPAK